MKRLLARVWASFLTYQERRAMYLMLNKLTARQLQDMGLDREEFHKRFTL